MYGDVPINSIVIGPALQGRGTLSLSFIFSLVIKIVENINERARQSLESVPGIFRIPPSAPLVMRNYSWNPPSPRAPPALPRTHPGSRTRLSPRATSCEFLEGRRCRRMADPMIKDS